MTVPPIPSAPADLELIAHLKSRLRYAELRIRVLEERLRLMRIEKYGGTGEKLSDLQSELFEIDPSSLKRRWTARPNTSPHTALGTESASIPAARSYLWIFLASSGFCFAPLISAYANAAAEER